MSALDDLSKRADADQSSYKPVKETMLSKYNIPIQHFEFDYVENCDDAKELEKILQVLRSGEEGYFPDLMKATEEQLRKVKPKSKLLRKLDTVKTKQDLNREELNQINQDLEHFVSDISKQNKELEMRKSNALSHETDIRIMRQAEDTQPKCSDKRISSTDYNAWDKYDPDTELLKMEMEEENVKKAVLEQQKGTKSDKPKKSVSFNKFATEAEALFLADREKEKGKEFFKAGDFEEALECYTNSILSKPCANNLNNRAVTYLKLRKFDSALKDCNKVLSIDSDNLKAHLRKAQALEGLKMFEDALKNVEFVIERDPNNCVAQELADRIRGNCEGKSKNTRMKIVEIE